MIVGIVRFTQLKPKESLVELEFAGLPPGKHAVAVHSSGDVSGNACENCGPHYNPLNKVHGDVSGDERHAGDLGNVIAGSDGRARLQLITTPLDVDDIIGRSVVVYAGEDDLGKGRFGL